jgi:adenosylcobinamide-phosphate synthase
LTPAGSKRIVAGVMAGLYPGLLTYGCAVLLDFSVRLPTSLHPVAWFGKLAAALIRRAPLGGPLRAGSLGLLLAAALPLAAASGVHHALGFAARVGTGLSFGIDVLLLYSCVCLYGLLDAAQKLSRALRSQGLPAARERLTWLCSRDPSGLDESGLANGTIESLAENLSDSVVAPLFFLLCFGLEGAIAYRAINTLDAMIGYRGRYEWLGKAAARIDDVANYAPARLTALLLLAAGASLALGRTRGLSLSRGVRVWRADHARTASPNGGHPMAMAAGLLGVRLDKPDHYVLGSQLPAATALDIERAIALCARAGNFALCAGALGLYALRGQLV